MSHSGGMDRRTVDRRTVLVGLGGLAALGACQATPPPGGFRFPDGVACGDPRPDGAVIWSRVTAPADPRADVLVTWEIATDDSFTNVLQRGSTWAVADTGHAAKVAVQGLDPDGWYAYRFFVGNGEAEGVSIAMSQAGRLRTAPAPDSSPDRLRFGFVSCQQTSTTYVAMEHLAREDIDFVLHLGDYVYVSDGGTLTRPQYRDVYQRFRQRRALRDLHAAVPLVAMWDDGEIVNGADRTLGGRLDEARHGWLDSMPNLADAGDPTRLYRSLRWGDLVDMPVIDVRSFRDPEVEAIDASTPEGAEMFEAGRTTLGATQKAWLLGELASSSAAWRVIGNPYNFGAWKLLDRVDPGVPNGGTYTPNEAWDDYQAERRELLEFLDHNGIPRTVFASGHTHTYLATDLQPDFDDPASPVVAHDFVTGSLTADPDPREAAAPGDPELGETIVRALEAQWISQNSPYLRYANIVNQGYSIMEVTPDEVTVEVVLVDTADASAQPRRAARFRVSADGGPMETVPSDDAPEGTFAP